MNKITTILLIILSLGIIGCDRGNVETFLIYKKTLHGNNPKIATFHYYYKGYEYTIDSSHKFNVGDYINKNKLK